MRRPGLVSLLLVDPCEDLGGPTAAARRSLQLAHDINETMGVVRALDMHVGALADEGNPREAVRVAGATDALRRRTGYAEHEPGRRAYRTARLDRARDQLGRAAYDVEWDEGRRLDHDGLINELLGPTT